MFKPPRKKVVKTKEKATFKLEFHVTQVPQQRWDKLLVSLVSLDTGKTSSKTTKSPVRNGTCHLAEALLESVSMLQDSSGNDVVKESFKFVVSTGLSRLGILGDATINFTDYLQSATPVSLSLPLQNCKSGSILHVKLQRVFSKSASRDGCEQQEVLYQSSAALTHHDGEQDAEMDLIPSAEVTAHGQEYFPQAHTGELVDVPSTPLREERPLHGIDDDDFMSLNSSSSSSFRLEVMGSVYDGDVMTPEKLPDRYDTSSRDQGSLSLQISLSNPHRLRNGEEISPITSPPKVGYGEKSKLETSQHQTRIQRTASLARPSTWEHDGNQVAVAEIEALRQQLATEAKRSEEVHKKLSILIEERDSIKQEMESLKLMEVSTLNSRDGGPKWLQEDARQIMKELQDELDYVQGINVNLSVQLEKTQESNSELLLEIQDLAEKLERQRGERENESIRLEEQNMDSRKLEALRKQLADLQRDFEERTEKNLDLLSELKQANDELKVKNDIIAKLSAEKVNTNSSDHATIRNENSFDYGLRETRREIEDARIAAEKQSQSFLDRTTTSDDHLNAIGIIKNFEAACETLEQEKDETIHQELRKQLSAMSGLYNEQVWSMEDMIVKKTKLEVELTAVLRSQGEERAALHQLQTVNAELHEKLHQEQANTCMLMQQCKVAEGNSLLHQKELDALHTQLNLTQHMMTELETSRKDLTMELHGLREKERCGMSQLQDLEAQTAMLKDEIDSLRASKALLEAEVQELKSPKDTNWSKQLKTCVEENYSHFHDANLKSVRRPLEERNTEATEHLQKQINELSWRLSEKDVDLQESKTKVFYLEEELQHKVSALMSAERRLQDQKESLSHDVAGQVSYMTRSLSRMNSRVGPNRQTIASSREAKEVFDLRSKVKLLEAEVKKKAVEVEALKEQMKDQCTQFLSRIEQLELTNKELTSEDSNSKLERALKELSCVQNQNGVLCQRENDLQSRLALQEALQCEMDTLKTEKGELEVALAKFNAAGKGENVLKRISTLETELAEVFESNLMYRTQLQSIFAKQQNVHTAALENLDSVDKVIRDLAELKRKNMILEDELCDMKERYFSMSLQFAEVEAEREELVMTIRTLRGTKKFVPLRSAIF